jgi:hypothetical protein
MLRTFGPKRKRQLFQRLSLGNWAAFPDSRKASLENVFIKPKSLNSDDFHTFSGNSPKASAIFG